MGTFPVLILFTLKVLLRLRIDGLLDQKKVEEVRFRMACLQKKQFMRLSIDFFCMILFVHRSNLTDDIK